MKANQIKRIAVGLLAAAVCLAMTAGCAGGGDSPSPQADAGAAPSGTSPEQAQEEGGSGSAVENMNAVGLPILNEKETFAIAIKKESLSKNTMDEKECVTYTEEQTNVHIDWTEIPDSNWSEKVNIMFASGDLPDAFMGDVDIMKNREALTPIGGIIDTYAPHFQLVFQEVPALRPALTTPDGNIYSLPTGDDNIQNSVGEALFINQVWLDNLGLDTPTTTDELYDVLVAFRDGDPNGNGDTTDEIPLLVSNASESAMLNSLFGSFGTLDVATLDTAGAADYVRVENGTVIFTPGEENYYRALQYFHQLYREGLMNQDYFTEQFAQFKAKGDSEIAIAGVVKEWYIDNIIAVNNMDQYVILPALKGPDGTTMWNRNPAPSCSINGFSITTVCSKPEVLVRWFDYINSDLEILNLWNYGPLGHSWDYTEDGRWEIIDDYVPEGSSLSEMRRTVAVGPRAIYAYSRYRGEEVEKFNTRFEGKLECVKTFRPVAPDEIIPKGFDEIDRADRRNLLKPDIDNYIKKFRAEAITQGIDDDSWSQHLRTLESIGAEEYTSLWQAFYDMSLSVS